MRRKEDDIERHDRETERATVPLSDSQWELGAAEEQRLWQEGGLRIGERAQARLSTKPGRGPLLLFPSAFGSRPEAKPARTPPGRDGVDRERPESSECRLCTWEGEAVGSPGSERGGGCKRPSCQTHSQAFRLSRNWERENALASFLQFRRWSQGPREDSLSENKCTREEDEKEEMAARRLQGDPRLGSWARCSSAGSE